jgi:hypothetical protein
LFLGPLFRRGCCKRIFRHAAHARHSRHHFNSVLNANDYNKKSSCIFILCKR